MKRRGKYSFLKANAGNLIFFLLLVRWVLNKFYEHHWSLKHKDRQTHRAKETRPSLGCIEVCPCSQQVMHHMRKSKGIPALGSFQKAEFSGVSGLSLCVEISRGGQPVAPTRGIKFLNQGKCPGSSAVILRFTETSQRSGGVSCAEAQAWNQNCLPVLLDGEVHTVYTHKHMTSSVHIFLANKTSRACMVMLLERKIPLFSPVERIRISLQAATSQN